MIRLLAEKMVRAGYSIKEILTMNPKEKKSEEHLINIGKIILSDNDIRDKLLVEMSEALQEMRWLFDNIEVGTQFTIRGEIKYMQDYAFKRKTFSPQLRFTVKRSFEDGTLKLEAYRYGEKIPSNLLTIYVPLECIDQLHMTATKDDGVQLAVTENEDEDEDDDEDEPIPKKPIPKMTKPKNQNKIDDGYVDNIIDDIFP